MDICLEDKEYTYTHIQQCGAGRQPEDKTISSLYSTALRRWYANITHCLEIGYLTLNVTAKPQQHLKNSLTMLRATNYSFRKKNA